MKKSIISEILSIEIDMFPISSLKHVDTQAGNFFHQQIFRKKAVRTYGCGGIICVTGGWIEEIEILGTKGRVGFWKLKGEILLGIEII